VSRPDELAVALDSERLSFAPPFGFLSLALPVSPADRQSARYLVPM